MIRVYCYYKMFWVAFFATFVAASYVLNANAFQLKGRIVGGRRTTIEEFPYQVSILLSRVHICSGSIYQPDVIITAAHCLKDVAVQDLTIVAGTADWEFGGIEVPAKSFISHPRFSSTSFDFDIGIVYLMTKLTFSPSIQPIKLPKYRQEFKPGSTGVVSGWGALNENGDEPDYLQFTALKIVDSYDCVKAYRTIHPVTKNMICAGFKPGGKGSCQGDSGSALVIGNVMAGIVSWGLGCARQDIPEIYTKISTLRKWLDIHTTLS